MNKRFNNNLIILIIIVFLAGYFRVSNLTQPIWPDEALYAKTAENLYNGKGLTFDGTPWNHQPPLFVLILTLAYAILGVSETSARIVGPIFGILGVITIYYLGKYLYNEKVGIIAAFFLGVTPVHWFLSRMVLTDIVLTTLITLTILFFYISTEMDRRYSLAAGILIALSCLSKRIGPIIYLILGSYLIVSERNLDWIKRKDLQTIFGISLLLQLPWYVIKYGAIKGSSIIYFSGASEFSTPNPQSVSTVLKVLPYTVSKPILLFVPLGIFFMFKKMKKEDILVLSPVFIFLFVFMSWGGTWIEAPRYLLPIVPFFCIISAYGVYVLSERIEKRSIYAYFMILLVFFTIVVNAGQGREMTLIEWERYSGYDKVSVWLDKNTLQDSIIVTDSRIIRYYSKKNFIYYAPNALGFQKFLEVTSDDIYLVLDSRNRISPRYIRDYIKKHHGFVHNVATFDTGQKSKVEIYALEKT